MATTSGKSNYINYFKTEEKKKMDSCLIFCSAVVNKKQVTCIPQMVYMPKDLSDRLKKVVTGNVSPAIVGLLEYVLDKFEKESKVLVVSSKE